MVDLNFILKNADQVLANKGLVKDCEDETVRQFLYFLYAAIDMYRYMNDAERNKAGYWYRIFKGTYTLRDFLKERKRKREKEKSPLHPSNKVKSGVKEKAKTVYIYADSGDSGVDEDMESRRNAFYRECMSYKDKYDEEMISDFYAYYGAANKLSKKMCFEEFDYWDTAKMMHLWVNNPISKAKAAAAIKLKRVKGKTANGGGALNGGRVLGCSAAENSPEQKAIAAEREAADAKREAEMAEARKGSIPLEEYTKRNPNSALAKMYAKKPSDAKGVKKQSDA
jgi:hypothetical protein